MKLSELAAAVREMMPEFEVVDGCYTYHCEALHPTARIRCVGEWILQCSGSRKRAEQSMNHRHILDLLWLIEDGDREASDLLVVAEAYASLLRDRLSRAFEDQRFSVEVWGRERIESEPWDLIVTFSREAE